MLPRIIHLTPSHPELVKGYPINQYTARASVDYSFNPFPTYNILKVLELTNSWPLQLRISHLTYCNPGYVKGYYFINPFMARAPDDPSVDPKFTHQECIKGC